MQFLVAGDDPDTIVATMDALMDAAEDQLTLRQDELDTAAEDRIEVQRISTDNEPTPGFGSRRRAQILLAAVGLLVTMASAIAVDALLYFARRRKSSDDGDALDDDRDWSDPDDDPDAATELSLFDESLLTALEEQHRGRPDRSTLTMDTPADAGGVGRRISEPVGGPERTA